MLRRSSSRPQSARTNPSQRQVRKLDTDRQLLHQEAEAIRKLEEKIRQKEVLARQRLESLPKELAERQRKQQELMRLHLVAAPSRADGISKLRDKREVLRSKPASPSGGKRLAERRAARMQFILLCAVLLIILLLLWRSLPS